MNGELGLIFGFTLAALWIIFRRPGRYRHRDWHAEDTAAREANAELRAELDRLEERIRVLERIVTDDREDLRRQFRDLGK